MGGGKGGGGDAPEESQFEKTLAKIANEMYTATGPIRTDVLGQLGQVTSGGYRPETSPIYAPAFSAAKQATEGQYGVAKENILSNTPRGGAQVSALENLESNRATQMGALPAQISMDIMNDMVNKAYGAAFNAPNQAMGGLSTAASSYGQRQAAAMQSQAAENSAKYGGLGSIVGLLGGSMMGDAFAGKGGSTNPFA